MSGSSMSGASVRQKLPDYEEKILERYMDHLSFCEYSLKSKRYNYFVIHHHLRYCSILEITNQKLLDYFYSLSNLARATISSKLKVLKKFYVFCFEQKILDVDYTPVFPSSKNQKNIEIPSVFTPTEIRQVLNYLRDYNENRRRNYAIALLAAIYGFRAGDIASMKMTDINWETETIVIIQAKTKEKIEHRLMIEVGNAFVKYILEERPTSDQPIIFLKGNGQPLNDTSISSMVFNGFLRSGVELKGRKHGTHSLRHSLASNMLAEKVNILDISKALGHTSLESTKIYAKVDVSHLQLCELEVPTSE
jgi:site-specific recombinase XerD